MFRENSISDPGRRKRRDRLYIMAEILEIAKNGSLKTQVMYRANLSFAQLNEYLNFLLEVGLLKEARENEKAIYRTTQKGGRFLQNYYKIKDLLRGKSGGSEGSGGSGENGKGDWENCGALCLGNHRAQDVG